MRSDAEALIAMCENSTKCHAYALKALCAALWAGEYAAVERAKAAGVEKIVMPGIDSNSYSRLLHCGDILQGFAYPATGLHPTEVTENWRDSQAQLRNFGFTEQ